MTKKRKNSILSVSLPIQYFLIQWLSNYPTIVEKYYAKGIFPIFTKIFRTSIGWIPFSVGDLLVLFLLYKGIKLLISFFKRNNEKLSNKLLRFSASIAIIYGLFHLFWALNYYRLPLAKQLNIPEHETIEEKALLDFTNTIAAKLNQIHVEIVRDSTKKVMVPYSFSENKIIAVAAYNNLSKEYPFFHYGTPSIKKTTFGIPQLYMGFNGYINPLTMEAQVNGRLTKVREPITMLHEMAHQIGYAAENEANFIASLAALKSTDKYYQFAGNLYLLDHCLGAIYRADPTLYKTYLSKLNSGILLNKKEIRDHHKKYDNVLEPYFKLFYNSYLEANQQKDGIKSYNKMLNLFIAYYTNDQPSK